jgi:hypothetical protein
MVMPSVIVDDYRETCGYLQDDVVRSLKASLVSVLSTALATHQASSEYLSGVLALARSQAALYGIPWCDLVASLYDVPEIWNLNALLQEGCRGF